MEFIVRLVVAAAILSSCKCYTNAESCEPFISQKKMDVLRTQLQRIVETLEVQYPDSLWNKRKRMCRPQRQTLETFGNPETFKTYKKHKLMEVFEPRSPRIFETFEDSVEKQQQQTVEEVYKQQKQMVEEMVKQIIKLYNQLWIMDTKLYEDALRHDELQLKSKTKCYECPKQLGGLCIPNKSGFLTTYGYYVDIDIHLLCEYCYDGCTQYVDGRYNCHVCKPGRWGQWCQYSCIPCSECIDRWCKKTCTKPNNIINCSNGKCPNRCTLGFFGPQKSEQGSCIKGCRDCRDTQCRLCQFGLFLYVTDGTTVCKKCPKPCESCKLDSFHNNIIQCISCPYEYYLHKQNGIANCKECPYGCLGCVLNSVHKSTVQCTSCKNGYYLNSNNTDGIIKCSIRPKPSSTSNSSILDIHKHPIQYTDYTNRYYFNNNNNNNLDGIIECSVCPIEAFHKNSIQYTSCKKGYYLNTNNPDGDQDELFTCRQCPIGCGSCILVNKYMPQCSRYKHEYYLHSLYYRQIDCPVMCETYVLKIYTTLKCTSCNDGYYFNYKNSMIVCEKCPEGCSACELYFFDIQMITCTSCEVGNLSQQKEGIFACERSNMYAPRLGQYEKLLVLIPCIINILMLLFNCICIAYVSEHVSERTIPYFVSNQSSNLLTRKTKLSEGTFRRNAFKHHYIAQDDFRHPPPTSSSPPPHRQIYNDEKKIFREDIFCQDQFSKDDFVNPQTRIDEPLSSSSPSLDYECTHSLENSQIYYNDDKEKYVKGTKGQRLEEETDAMVYDSDTINDICHRHGRKSEQLRLQCKEVSREIQSVSSLIQCVRPGYRLLEPEKVVFVVFTEHREQIELPHHLQSLDIMFDIKSPSSEDKDVVTSDDVKRKGFTDNELNDLSTTLESKTDELLDKHKRLSIISACPVKSKRYGTPEAEIVNQTCIVLYVRVKGIIPLKEDQFPTEINGISTDVREGSFSFFGKSPKDYHETLKVGCQISSKESCFGTLGPFVMDEQNNVCSITSAHVLLSVCQYKWLQGVGEIDYTSDIISSYHPLPTVANSNFGHVSKGVIKSGGNGEAGIEVVLVKITNAGKIPNSITFPEFPIENIEAAGFQSFPTFTGLSYDGLARGLVYLKFGCETNITRGKLYFSGAIVKLDSYPYTKLHKQIQILSDCSQQFAKHGDSGSLVAIGYNGELVDLRAIGIVTGGVLTSEVTFVTPMKDILTALDCSLLKFPEGMDTSN